MVGAGEIPAKEYVYSERDEFLHPADNILFFEDFMSKFVREILVSCFRSFVNRIFFRNKKSDKFAVISIHTKVSFINRTYQMAFGYFF